MLYRVEICFDTVLMLTILHCNTIYILNIVPNAIYYATNYLHRYIKRVDAIPPPTVSN